MHPPEPARFAPDPITCDVIDLVRGRFGAHFGDIEPSGLPSRLPMPSTLSTSSRRRLCRSSAAIRMR
ncbi:MAG: hypothetical protein U0S49_00255 [Rhodospirillales bacterium]|nr:hypothetical protein [Rhodospirillales bacterium]